MTLIPAETAWRIEPFNAEIDIPADIALMHLGIRRWQEEIGQNAFTNILDSQADLCTVPEYYIEPGGNFFIAKDACEAVLGFVGVRRDNHEHGIIKRLAVLPAHHGRGIGHALVDATITWARDSALTRLSLYTGEAEHAKTIYEKFGFRVVSLTPPKIGEYGDLLMELELGT